MLSLNKKQITKLLLEDELHIFEAMPVSLDIESQAQEAAFNVTNRIQISDDRQEAILTLRLYDEESIRQAMKLTDKTFFGKFAIVRLPDEV